MRKKIFSIIKQFVIPVFLIGHFLSRPGSAYETRYAVIAVIDGARYTETFGDSAHTLVPRLWNRLRPQGTMYSKFYNDSVTFTLSGHAAILTGTWQNVLNSGEEPPHFPTVFEYYKKSAETAPTENYIVLGTERLAVMAWSDFPGYGNAYGAIVKTADSPYEDLSIFEAAKNVLRTAHPRLTIINFKQVDNIGHMGDWDGYRSSIANADSLVAGLWDFLQADSVFRNATTLFVTNDHGRHTLDFTSHGGDGCEGCRRIMLLMLGPDTEKGIVDTLRREQIDIAPTIGELMDFSTPYCTGTSLVPVRPPLRAVLRDPQDGAAQQPLAPTLSWSPVNRAKYYRVQIFQEAGPDHPDVDDTAATESYKVESSLSVKTRYRWRVCAVNSGGTGSWSEVRDFSTIERLPAPRSSLTAFFLPGVGIVVRYHLSAASTVRINIYNVIGRLLKKVVDSDASAGLHQTVIADAGRCRIVSYTIGNARQTARCFFLK